MLCIRPRTLFLFGTTAFGSKSYCWGHPATSHDEKTDSAPEKSKIECAEHQHDAQVSGQSLPETVAEERNVNANDNGDHRCNVNDDGNSQRGSSHALSAIGQDMF